MSTKNTKDLTEGPILGSLLLFSLPMFAGNLLQQVYNIADTVIVGRFISANALAAVGSSYTLMSFLTSLVIGLCMGSGALFSASFGAGKLKQLRLDVWLTACFILAITLAIYVIVFPGTDIILHLLQVPQEVYPDMRVYIRIIFVGIGFTALYNFFAYLLRSVGNSRIPVYFLALASLLNVALDLLAVIVLKLGVAGAAAATVISQGIAASGLAVYTICRIPEVRVSREDMKWDGSRFRFIAANDIATGLQQSVMTFGILMVQGLVNSFGASVMSAFAAANKIDTFAMMMAKEFANAYSFFISQNFGARKKERIRKGTVQAFAFTAALSIAISLLVWFLAGNLMTLFVSSEETAIINEGIRYLHIEGALYIGIGILQLWYACFRAVQKPHISLVLTIVSLGSRVLLSYTLAPHTALGVTAIWAAIPIGWGLADLTGWYFYRTAGRKALDFEKKEL